jgi:hypothetical protein
MRTLLTRGERWAFTVLELMLVVAALAVLVLILLPPLDQPRDITIRINCVNNLKQDGLAFRLWSSDNNNLYPMGFYTNEDGSLKFADARNLFRYFQVLSNELNTPKILCCPADSKGPATNFTTDFDNSHVSYFVGLDADETQPAMLLAGDRNMTNGTPLLNGLRIFTTNQPVGWTAEIHKFQGNVTLVDGSVEQLNNSRLRAALANAGTNRIRLLFP